MRDMNYWKRKHGWKDTDWASLFCSDPILLAIEGMSAREREQLIASVADLCDHLVRDMNVQQLARLARAIQQPSPGSEQARKLVVAEREDSPAARVHVLQLLCGMDVGPFTPKGGERLHGGRMQ